MKVIFLDIDGVLNSARSAIAFGNYPCNLSVGSLAIIIVGYTTGIYIVYISRRGAILSEYSLLLRLTIVLVIGFLMSYVFSL